MWLPETPQLPPTLSCGFRHVDRGDDAECGDDADRGDADRSDDDDADHDSVYDDDRGDNVKESGQKRGPFTRPLLLRRPHWISIA